jgi:lactate permease
VPALHLAVQKMPPVAPVPTLERTIFNLNLLSATGTPLLLAGIASALCLGVGFRRALRIYGQTWLRVRVSLLTISAMMALGFMTRYGGTDTTMGLAMAGTGSLFPFFSPIIGWLGVALTGSDTASNVLFGNLQKVSAEQLGYSPLLMCAANSSGGVMGKMIDAQSIVVASTATQWFGHEGDILRYVFFHSVALAALVGLLVTLQAYVWPFTLLVVGH